MKGGEPRSGGGFLSMKYRNPLGFAVSPFLKGNIFIHKILRRYHILPQNDKFNLTYTT